MVRWLAGVVSCAVFALAVPGCEPRAEGGGVKLTINLSTRSYVLPNGLQVHLQPDHREPYVHVRVEYHVGSKDDPKGRAGLAHLYEHLMFSAAKHMPTDDYLGTLDRIGATEFNGTTEEDVTTYFETVPRGALEIALFLEGERMGFAPAAITPGQIERERRIVREEYRQRTFNEPYGLVRSFVRKALLPLDHPYARGSDDRDAETPAITEADVRAFGAAYYVPNDATLVIVGDFDEEAVKPLVAKYFGSIPAGTNPPPSHPVAPVLAPRVRETEVRANVDVDEVVLAWTGPAYSDDGWREHRLAAGMLADYTGGRLRKKDDTLSKNGASWADESGALGSIFMISMRASGKGSLDDLVDAYEYTQRWMREADELNIGDEQSAILVGGLYGIESASGRADRIVDYERRLGSPDAVMADLRAYQAIPRARVLLAIREALSLSRAAIVRVRKDPSAPVCGRLP
jgi:zinc protease